METTTIAIKDVETAIQKELNWITQATQARDKTPYAQWTEDHHRTADMDAAVLMALSRVAEKSGLVVLHIDGSGYVVIPQAKQVPDTTPYPKQGAAE